MHLTQFYQAFPHTASDNCCGEKAWVRGYHLSTVAKNTGSVTTTDWFYCIPIPWPTVTWRKDCIAWEERGVAWEGVWPGKKGMWPGKKTRWQGMVIFQGGTQLTLSWS